ncbi:MAG: hypothetical protein RL088_3544 [Verrucomicrobiota bacterium]|jgi:DNA-binding XRE family transcriptional regulator
MGVKPNPSANPNTTRRRSSLRDGVRRSRETALHPPSAQRPVLRGEEIMDKAVRILHMERLRQCRRLDMVARAAGITPHGLNLIETGRRNPLGVTFVNLCLALDQCPGAVMLAAAAAEEK